jgi:hypothetical protein
MVVVATHDRIKHTCSHIQVPTILISTDDFGPIVGAILAKA